MMTSALALSIAASSTYAETSQAEEQRFIVTFKAESVESMIKLSDQSLTPQQAKTSFFNSVATEVSSEVIKGIPSANTVALMLNNEQKAQLENDARVQTIEIDPKRYLYSESTPYGITMVQANQLSDSGTVNQKVCIVDTGYMLNHADLPSSGITGDDGYGSNNTGNWYNDGNGHGTHVAGTIAAIGGNGQGVVGVNPSGKLGLHIVKVFNDSGNWAYGSDLIEAVNQCRAAGSSVISMSLGGGASSTAEQSAFDQAYAAGVLPIAAAGNDGDSKSSYPASYSSVVSVAAVDSSGNKASFSQYNSQVEIAAPGVGVNSTYNNGGYKSLSGTSMATPHVSGVAALVWGNNPKCTAKQIRDGLNATAQDKGTPGRDTQYGYGIVKAKAAHDYLKNICGTTENQAPDAGFTNTSDGLTASFTNTSTDDNAVTSSNWNFGDGSTSTATNPTHTYAIDGTYQVTLTVADAQGLTDSISHQVTVDDDIIIGDCAPAWSASTNYQIGDKVTFEGYEYESTWWSTGASPAIYSNVWRKLEKCDGTTNPDKNKPPVSSFSYSPNKLSVTFNNNSTDDKAVTSVSWNFGDGATSTATNPTHTYSEANSYQVSLTVYDAEGLSHTSSQTVVVEDDVIDKGCDGIAAWSATTSYAVGDKVVYNNKKYDAIWWSTGASPEVFSNVWSYTGNCQ